MNEPVSAQILSRPTPEESRQAAQRARRLFSRSLACWASDLLTLSGAGLSVPAWRADLGDDDAWSRAA